MGVSRSASIVIAFLMKEYGMNYKEAHLFTKTKRDVINPNASF
jgi:protein-tyrosine phosphatase